MQEAEAYRADSLAFVLSQLYGLDQGVRMLGLRGKRLRRFGVLIPSRSGSFLLLFRNTDFRPPNW